MDNHKVWHLVKSLNKRGQPYKDLGIDPFKQRELQIQGPEVSQG